MYAVYSFLRTISGKRALTCRLKGKFGLDEPATAVQPYITGNDMRGLLYSYSNACAHTCQPPVSGLMSPRYPNSGAGAGAGDVAVVPPRIPLFFAVQGVFMYWIPSSLFQIGQGRAMKNASVREFLRLQPLGVPPREAVRGSSSADGDSSPQEEQQKSLTAGVVPGRKAPAGEPEPEHSDGTRSSK